MNNPYNEIMELFKLYKVLIIIQSPKNGKPNNWLMKSFTQTKTNNPYNEIMELFKLYKVLAIIQSPKKGESNNWLIKYQSYK